MKLIYTIAIDDTSKAYKTFEEWHDIILCGVNLTDQSLGIYRDYTNNKVSFTVDVSADTSKQRFEVRGRYLRAFFERFGHFIDSNDIQVSIKVTDQPINPMADFFLSRLLDAIRDHLIN